MRLGIRKKLRALRKSRKRIKKMRETHKNKYSGFFSFMNKPVITYERADKISDIGINIHDRNTKTNQSVNLQVQFPAVTATKNFKEFPAGSLQSRPLIKWSKQQFPVTFICWDPDVPKKVEGGVYIHWLVTHIKSEITDGFSHFDWVPPNPPRGTGSHRYLFGIFEEHDGIPTWLSLDGRTNFPLSEFTNKNDLQLLDWVVVSTSENR